MYFGLNKAIYSHIIRYSASFGVVFRIGNRHAHLMVDKHTPENLIKNMVWALGMDPMARLRISEWMVKVWHEVEYGHELYVWLEYHNELPYGKEYTFLHIPGTLEHGRVFDKMNADYIGYEKDGRLIYVDPRTQEESVVSRTKEYMDSHRTRPQGTQTIFAR